MPWPPQSPDLNLIEQHVDTNGDQIMNKKTNSLCYLPGICGKTEEADSSNRSSIDPWTELWHEQDGWGTRGNPWAIGSE